MFRNMKVLGLAVVAVLAMSAVVAASASAAFNAENEGTTLLSGSQTNTHEFTVNTGTVTCTTATFAGSQSGKTSSTLSITPTYEGCTNSLLGSMSVNMNGCTYLFHTEATTGEPINGKVDVVCSGTNEIEVKRTSGVQVCTVKVPAQTGLGAVKYTNKSGSVEVEAEVTGLHYSQSGALCLGGTGSFTNGTYKGKVLESGKTTEGTAVNISVTSP